MERRMGLTDKELKRFFAQIKGNNSEMIIDHIGNQIYKAYLPAVDVYAGKYHISKEEVQDIFTDTFSGVYNAVIEDNIQGSDFDTCFHKCMHKECEKFIKTKAERNQFRSKMMEMSYAKTVPAREQDAEDARISLMYTSQLLSQLKRNPKLAEEKGLTPEKISMLEDYCGLNELGRTYTIAELAKKYNVTEKRAEVMIVTAKKAVRHMKEFEFIVNR